MKQDPEFILATDRDFAIMRGERVVASAEWSDVTEIRAYKRDELTTDLVCLDVYLANGAAIFVHEEAPGWDDFLEAAERELSGIVARDNWLAQVVKPAFARNETTIYERRG